ncbi:MAG: hypothetical protein A2017_15980 [Lentisphaerae bacterium GWF2_44_16]|nr:MAG: hypothetical protein A2017_15980 [Lentisphaerae bacterium GWF2_44_16]
MASEQELNNLKGKLNALSGVLRLGHEAFQKSTVNAVALHIVNNTRLVSAYDRASLANMRRHPLIEAVSGQPIIDGNSEFCTNMRSLLASFTALKTPLKLNEAFFKESKNTAPEALETFRQLAGEHNATTDILLLPLPPPPGGNSPGHSRHGFIWALEFFNGISQAEENILTLLAQHYSEAIWHKTGRPLWTFRDLMEAKSLSPLKITFFVLIIFLLALCVVRIRQYVVADFEITPYRENICYSRITGIVSRVLHGNGSYVSEGGPLIEFDRSELNYNLASAIKSYEQTCAELDVNRQKSFNNAELLGKTRVLTLKKEQEAINIEKYKWLLSQITVRAPRSGILSINGREKLEGKLIRAGEKLCEVIISSDLIAEVYLNERDASVLGPDMSVDMYLHTRPEKAIRGKILSISPKPMMMEDRRFCYLVKIMPDDIRSAKFICGTRGVARIGGARVSLGYYLFRNAVLWWRKI